MNALEYRPAVIDHGLARVYMLEEVWRICADIGVTFRRSSAPSKGALDHDCTGFATPARAASPFLRVCAGVRPTPRQTCSGRYQQSK